MIEKRKRGELSKAKRESDPYRLEFVTALSVEEGVERLREKAFGTVDRKLSVRADGRRFVVERPEQRDWFSGRIVELKVSGEFASVVDGTRVMMRVMASPAPTQINWWHAMIVAIAIFSVLGLVSDLSGGG